MASAQHVFLLLCVSLLFRVNWWSSPSLPFHFSAEDSDSATVYDAKTIADKMGANLPTFIGKKGLHFLHINIRSLIPKLPELRHLVYETKAAVIAISESWLDETISDGDIRVDGYSVLRRDRNRNGGGVLVFIKDGLAFNRRPDLEVDGLETLWVELLLPKTKGILFGCCYRPPHDRSFLGKFETVLKMLNPADECFIMGDMNINMLKNGSDMCSEYNNLLRVFNLKG